MRKNKKKIYIIEIILLLYILFYGIYVVNYIPKYANHVSITFWIMFFMYLFLFEGFVKDRSYYKKGATKIVIITLLAYFLITFLLGFFLGFSYGIVKLDLYGSIITSFALIINFVFMELSRYIILKKNPQKRQIILLTIEFIIINILLLTGNENFSTFSKIFIIFSTIMVPTIANEFLYTYMSYEISYVPVLIYKIVIETYAYLFPVLPSIGNYLISVTGVILPFATYVLIRRLLLYNNKKNVSMLSFTIKYVNIIATSFLIVLIVLTSGIFKYQLVSIVSNSMLPTYARGDAVFVVKMNASEIEVGDVLVFNMGYGIITHRVVDITYKNNERIFTTRGDNNDTNDIYEIYDKNVIGKVKYVIKYAGYPTVLINEFLERN